MNPFDQVTFEIEVGDITYNYGGTVVATYDNEDSEEMCMVSVLGGQVLHVKASGLKLYKDLIGDDLSDN